MFIQKNLTKEKKNKKKNFDFLGGVKTFLNKFTFIPTKSIENIGNETSEDERNIEDKNEQAQNFQPSVKKSSLMQEEPISIREQSISIREQPILTQELPTGDNIARAIESRTQRISQVEYDYYSKLLKDRLETNNSNKEEKIQFPPLSFPQEKSSSIPNTIKPTAVHAPNQSSSNIVRSFLHRKALNPSDSNGNIKRPIGSVSPNLENYHDITINGNDNYPLKDQEESYLDIQPPKKKYKEIIGASQTAKRILETLDQMSTPLEDSRLHNHNVSKKRLETKGKLSNIPSRKLVPIKDPKTILKPEIKQDFSEDEEPPLNYIVVPEKNKFLDIEIPSKIKPSFVPLNKRKEESSYGKEKSIEKNQTENMHELRFNRNHSKKSTPIIDSVEDEGNQIKIESTKFIQENKPSREIIFSTPKKENSIEEENSIPSSHFSYGKEEQSKNGQLNFFFGTSPKLEEQKLEESKKEDPKIAEKKILSVSQFPILDNVNIPKPQSNEDKKDRKEEKKETPAISFALEKVSENNFEGKEVSTMPTTTFLFNSPFTDKAASSLFNPPIPSSEKEIAAPIVNSTTENKPISDVLHTDKITTSISTEKKSISDVPHTDKITTAISNENKNLSEFSPSFNIDKTTSSSNPSLDKTISSSNTIFGVDKTTSFASNPSFDVDKITSSSSNPIFDKTTPSSSNPIFDKTTPTSNTIFSIDKTTSFSSNPSFGGNQTISSSSNFIFGGDKTAPFASNPSFGTISSSSNPSFGAEKTTSFTPSSSSMLDFGKNAPSILNSSFGTDNKTVFPTFDDKQPTFLFGAHNAGNKEAKKEETKVENNPIFGVTNKSSDASSEKPFDPNMFQMEQEKTFPSFNFTQPTPTFNAPFTTTSSNDFVFGASSNTPSTTSTTPNLLTNPISNQNYPLNAQLPQFNAFENNPIFAQTNPPTTGFMFNSNPTSVAPNSFVFNSGIGATTTQSGRKKVKGKKTKKQ